MGIVKTRQADFSPPPAVPGLRPEMALLVCCCRTHVEEDVAAQISALVQQEIDWNYLVQIAKQHDVTPLLYWNLNALCPDAMPQAVRARLQAIYQNQAGFNLFLISRLFKLLQLLRDQDIPAVPFKGPVLAATAYQNTALRQYGDLDIFVQRQHVPKVRKLLLSQGYRQLVPTLLLTDAQEQTYLRLTHEYMFASEDDLVSVEIQWGFAARSFAFQLDLAGLWKRLGSATLAGRPVPAFAPEDVLLILCVDGCKACWSELKRICDVAELIDKLPELDWEGITRRARAIGCERILALGLFLAHDLLGAAVPGDVLRNIANDAAVGSLATTVYRRLLRGENRPFEAQLFPLFHLRARERLQDRLRYCAFSVTPTAKDWAFFPLPGVCYPLYYLLRPARLVQQVLKRAGVI